MSHEMIENALESLLEGFEELQGEIEQEVLGHVIEEPDAADPPSEEQLDRMDEMFFTKVQSSVAKLAESGRCEAGDMLAMISVLAEALEELAPELFDESEEEELEAE
ncbi:MAG: hypothetical protein ACYTGJ_06190 [Planctomycetota bacterium]|jgi:hypothetical protein